MARAGNPEPFKERVMANRMITMLALSAAAIFAGPASAVMCYTILDKSDSVLYSGSEPPVDLSMTAAGAAARDGMRRAGQYMIVSYVDECIAVGSSRWMSAAGTGTYAPASVDEIVSGMRPFAVGAPSGTPTSVGAARPAAAAPRAAAPAVRSGSSGMRSGY
jgi:hypothetical protein